MSGDRKYVGDLVVGNRFVWVDRTVTLVRIELDHRGARHPSRWLHVTDETGKAARLNYRDDETVAVA